MLQELPPQDAISAAGRRAGAVIAAIGWGALALQLLVTLNLTAADGRTAASGLWRYLGYFTILSNLLVAVTMTRVARASAPQRPGPSASTLTGVTLTIAIVGIVYDQLLSGIAPAMGWTWWTADRTLHYVIPASTVAWWLVFVPKTRLTFADPPRWLAFPVAYLCYALLRGGIDGWYPYFFIDVGALGYTRALGNAAALSALMLAAGFMVVAGIRLLRRR